MIRNNLSLPPRPTDTPPPQRRGPRCVLVSPLCPTGKKKETTITNYKNINKD